MSDIKICSNIIIALHFSKAVIWCCVMRIQVWEISACIVRLTATRCFIWPCSLRCWNMTFYLRMYACVRELSGPAASQWEICHYRDHNSLRCWIRAGSCTQHSQFWMSVCPGLFCLCPLFVCASLKSWITADNSIKVYTVYKRQLGLHKEGHFKH